MKERDLSYDDVYWVFKKPDSSEYAKAKDAWKFHKKHKNYRVTVVATKNEKGEWVMMSCWVRDFETSRKFLANKRNKFWKILWRDFWKMFLGK